MIIDYKDEKELDIIIYDIIQDKQELHTYIDNAVDLIDT